MFQVTKFEFGYNCLASICFVSIGGNLENCEWVKTVSVLGCEAVVKKRWTRKGSVFLHPQPNLVRQLMVIISVLPSPAGSLPLKQSSSPTPLSSLSGRRKMGSLLGNPPISSSARWRHLRTASTTFKGKMLEISLGTWPVGELKIHFSKHIMFLSWHFTDKSKTQVESAEIFASFFLSWFLIAFSSEIRVWYERENSTIRFFLSPVFSSCL